MSRQSEKDPHNLIRFLDKNDQRAFLKGPPTTMACFPDLIALRQNAIPWETDPSDAFSAPNIADISDQTDGPTSTDQLKIVMSWSSLEAVVENISKDKIVDESDNQEASYAIRHLQARPDLLATASLRVCGDECNVFFVDACKVYRTQTASWDQLVCKQLLYAFV